MTTPTPTTTETLAVISPTLILSGARASAENYIDACGAERHLAAQYNESSRRTQEFLLEALTATRRRRVVEFENLCADISSLRVTDLDEACRIMNHVRVRTEAVRIEAADRAAADAAAVRVVRLGVGA